MSLLSRHWGLWIVHFAAGGSSLWIVSGECFYLFSYDGSCLFHVVLYSGWLTFDYLLHFLGLQSSVCSITTRWVHSWLLNWNDYFFPWWWSFSNWVYRFYALERCSGGLRSLFSLNGCRFFSLWLLTFYSGLWLGICFLHILLGFLLGDSTIGPVPIGLRWSLIEYLLQGWLYLGCDKCIPRSLIYFLNFLVRKAICFLCSWSCYLCCLAGFLLSLRGNYLIFFANYFIRFLDY